MKKMNRLSMVIVLLASMCFIADIAPSGCGGSSKRPTPPAQPDDSAPSPSSDQS